MEDYKQINSKLTEQILKGLGKKELHQLRLRHENILKCIEPYISKTDNILEIGCRVGHLFELFKENNYINLYGIDISEYAINILKEKGFCGETNDAQTFNLNKKFDCIIISHCLEHCPNIKKVVSNIDNHLKSNGVLYVEVPKQKKESLPTPSGHYYCFDSLEDLIRFFSKTKWKLIYNEKLICVFKKEK